MSQQNQVLNITFRPRANEVRSFAIQPNPPETALQYFDSIVSTLTGAKAGVPCYWINQKSGFMIDCLEIQMMRLGPKDEKK